MKIHVVAYILLSSGLLVLGYLLILSWPPREGELPNKHEWSIVQAVDAKYRNNKVDGVVVESDYFDTGYDVIGLPSERNVMVWILANADGIPRIKIFPELQTFRISPDDYEMIAETVRLNDGVDALIRNAIEPVSN